MVVSLRHTLWRQLPRCHGSAIRPKVPTACFSSSTGKTPGMMTTTTTTTTRAATSTPRRHYSNGPNPPGGGGGGDRVKFWPFLAIIALGSGAYVLMVNQRKQGM